MPALPPDSWRGRPPQYQGCDSAAAPPVVIGPAPRNLEAGTAVERQSRRISLGNLQVKRPLGDDRQEISEEPTRIAATARRGMHAKRKQLAFGAEIEREEETHGWIVPTLVQRKTEGARHGEHLRHRLFAPRLLGEARAVQRRKKGNIGRANKSDGRHDAAALCPGTVTSGSRR